jgi:predicted transcriptional regulator of viral defense system
MNDTAKPDHEGLFETATEQAGYFTTGQALRHGFSSPLITYHSKSGRFVRVAHGIYRLRDYPSSPMEHLIAAWLRLAPDAVVSHDSALDVLGLSDIIPDQIHLSVPRSRRRLTRQPGVTIHTTKKPLDGTEVISRDGVRLTAPARTIVDVAESGIAPDQVVKATREAVDRGLTTPDLIRQAAQPRGQRVERLIEAALSGNGA